MPLVKTTAITLRSRKWGEADRIVTFYTLELGKVRGVARGARRMKSRFGSTLEPFALCHLNLFEKPGDSLFRILQVDLLQSFGKLREDLALMSAAARMVNLVAAVTADSDPEPRLFDTLKSALQSLLTCRDPALTTMLFQIRLLGQAGFKPQTDHCAGCGKPRWIGGTHFSPVSGGVICGICAGRQSTLCIPLSRGSLAFIQQALRLAPSVASRLHAVGQVRTEVEAAVEGYVTVVAGKRLPSVNFLV
ncbi:MAG: DNA repair protein RecO [Nitrospiraceae bacterium]